jgi:ribosomal protein L7/L12
MEGKMMELCKKLKDMSIVELKALVYDLLSQREYNVKQIQEVNILIAEKLQSELAKETKESNV